MIIVDVCLLSDDRYQGVYHLHSGYKKVLNFENENRAIVSIVNASVSSGPGRIRYTKDIDFLEHKDIALNIHEQNIMISGEVVSYERWDAKPLLLPFYPKNLSNVITYLEKRLGEKEKQLFDENSKVDQMIIQTIKEKLIQKDLEPLLGFGMGLTPLGDDCICGYLFGMSLFEEQLPDIYTKAKNKTTLISSEFLYHMNHKRVSDALYRLREGLFVNEIEKEEAVTEIMNYGSSSGYGILLGLKMYLERRRQNV